MPSQTNIAKNVNKIKRNIVSRTVKRHRALVRFGLSAFCLHPFQSGRSNARQTIPTARTATHKLERLLANQSVATQLSNELIAFADTTPKTVVNVDHTDANYLTSLVGAVQTGKGRAVPVFVGSTFAHDIPSFGSRHSTKRTDQLRKMRAEERKEISWHESIVSTLGCFVESLGFTPRFAFDRGFGSIAIISYLVSIDAIFYIRLKSGRIVDDGYQQIRVKDIKEDDEIVELEDPSGNSPDGKLLLRVVRSRKSRRCKEPWYILTNDFESGREKIIRIYYHRFEIEESFRDLKHIFEFKRVRFNKPAHLRVVLLFALLGISILHRIRQMLAKTQRKIPRKQRPKPPNPRKKLSFVREMYEKYVCFNRSVVWSF